MEKTLAIANEILLAIQFSVDAHINNPKTADDAVRFWDRKTPYIVHPTWCAMTILTETTLDEEIRLNGYKALLWHDVLEDTKIRKLPEGTSDIVIHYVNEMTFNSFTEEKEAIWSKNKEIRLLKLYDKTSNLLDGVWMSDIKWNGYIDFTLLLSDDVYKNYGDLNITKITRGIAVKR